jgi:hypothetical protein
VTVRALGYQQKVLEFTVDDGKHDSVQVELTPESQAPVGLPVEPR